MNPWIWILLGLGFLVGVGLVAYNVFFVEEEDDEDEERAKPGYDGGATMVEGGADADTLGETLLSTSEEMRGARKSRMLALKDSLERSLEGKEGAGAEAKDRLTMPWFLLIGAGGSGKTTMLANTGLPLPYGPAFEVDSRKRDAGRWWLFEDSVVLEAPPASAAAAVSDATLPPGQTIASDTSEGWNTLLHMLRRERPDAPLNGIIVTVSCADLVAGTRDSEKLVETAERIRTFLERTRNVLEVRLPLHVLVTKCDVLAGFRSFADNLPDGRRHDIFGWANPNKLETPFNPSWVDVGCDALKKELEDLRDEVLAAPDEIKDADGLFVFVNEFSNLQEPLRDFVSRLYHEGEKRPSLFFRGMYFCGDTIEPEVHESIAKEHEKAGKTRATMQLSAEVALTGTTSAHNLVFLRSLFTEKIFREAGLARPVARFRLSRDRRVVIAQVAAALIAVVGGAGLWTTVNGFQRGDTVMQRGLRADAEALAHALAGMAIDLDEMRRGGAAAAADASVNRRARDAAVIELVDEMRSLRTIKRSPFIPASWFSELPREVTTSMEAGIQDIVLPVIRQRLEERAKALLDSSAADTVATEAVMANPRILADYLNEVRTLSRHVTQYNRVARPGSGSLADLASLLDYLFGMQLDNASGVTSDDFQSALRNASAPAITLTPQMATTVISRSMQMVSSLAEQAGRQLAPPRNAQAERAIDPEADLLAFRQLGTLVDLSDARRGIVSSVSDSSILGVNLASLIQDSIASQVRSAAVRISGDSGAVDQAGIRLRRVIDTLFSYRLMDPVEPREIISDFAPGQRLRWDVGGLELALSMRQEHVRAILTASEAMPRQNAADRLRRAFDTQLRGRVLAVAASAQRITPITAASVPTVEVKLGAANLEAAADRLYRLNLLMDTLKAAPEGRKLLTAAMRQAEQAIGQAQWIIETDNALLPQPDKVAAWQGVIPLSWASVSVTDSLRFEGARLPLEGLVRDLTNDLGPVLRFLGRMPAAEVRIPKLVAEWNALSVNLARYDRGEASTVAALRRYLVGELAVKDLDACAQAAAQPDTTKPSPDPFTRRRRQFRAALAARCGKESADAVAAYQKLRTTFQTRLAGRYPFVDSTQAQAGDVDPVILRDFLAQYDAFMTTGEVALRSEAVTAAAAKDALAFLGLMAPVRAFLAPLVDAAEARKPIEFALLVPALDSVTTRKLVIGNKSIPLDAEPHDGTWVFGDAVRVTDQDSTGRARQVFASTRSWSVFSIPGQASVRFFHPATRVELMAPASFPASAPDISVPKAAAPKD